VADNTHGVKDTTHFKNKIDLLTHRATNNINRMGTSKNPTQGSGLQQDAQ
jgi:hypothetical protein